MNINAFAIINADNDTIARYDTIEEATAELAYFTEDYCVVDWFAFFHNVPAARIVHKIQNVRMYAAMDGINARIAAMEIAGQIRNEVGLSYEVIYGHPLY